MQFPTGPVLGKIGLDIMAETGFLTAAMWGNCEVSKRAYPPVDR